VAWAIYDTEIGRDDITVRNRVEWGECNNWPGEGMPVFYDAAAIEWPVIFPGAGNEVRDTIATAGIWWGRLGTDTLRIPRATVASALHVRGDKAINRVMARLFPALAGRAPGLNSHTRAAAAVAYVAAGKMNSNVLKIVAEWLKQQHTTAPRTGDYPDG
jgi:hypothetical protein